MLILSVSIFVLGIIMVLVGMRGKSPMMFLIFPAGIVLVILGVAGFGMYIYEQGKVKAEARTVIRAEDVDTKNSTTKEEGYPCSVTMYEVPYTFTLSERNWREETCFGMTPGDRLMFVGVRHLGKGMLDFDLPVTLMVDPLGSDSLDMDGLELDGLIYEIEAYDRSTLPPKAPSGN